MAIIYLFADHHLKVGDRSLCFFFDIIDAVNVRSRALFQSHAFRNAFFSLPRMIKVLFYLVELSCVSKMIQKSKKVGFFEPSTW